jgi:hypothetical protein
VATSASGKGGKLLVNGVELEVAGWETVSSTRGDGDGVCTGLDGVTAPFLSYVSFDEEGAFTRAMYERIRDRLTPATWGRRKNGKGIL